MPDELEGTCENVSQGIPLMRQDRWWDVLDRNPITAGGLSSPRASGASYGSSTEPSGCGTTRPCARDTCDYSFTDWIYGPTA